jgi:hypothetical protein
MLQGLSAPAAGPSFNSVLAFMDALNHNAAYVIWNKTMVPLNAAASLLLVAAGVGLLLLKNWARLASIGFGIYKIAFVMLNMAVLCLALRDILAKSMQGAGTVVIAMLGLAGFVGAILTLAYPVLLIYFLTRPKAVQAFQPAPTAPP